MSRLASASYPLRVTLSCGTASLLVLLVNRVPSTSRVFGLPLFAAVAACLASTPSHLGAAFKSGSHAVLGVVFGALLTSAALGALAVAPLQHQTQLARYVAFVVIAAVLLLPSSLPPLLVKLAFNAVLIGLFTYAPLTEPSTALLPLRMAASTVAGVAVTLAVFALPFPKARACAEAEAELRAGERHAAAFGPTLCRMAASNGTPLRHLSGCADEHRDAIAAALAAAKALADPVSWEAAFGSAPPRAASERLQLLQELLYLGDGALLAARAAGSAAVQNQRALRRGRLYGRHSDGGAGVEDDYEEARVLDFGLIDSLTAQPLARLADAAAALVDTECTDESKLRELEREAVAATGAFDAELLAARAVCYFGPVPAAPADVFGPPVEQFARLFFLRQFSAITLDALSWRMAAPPAPVSLLASLVASLQPYKLRTPDRVRLSYSFKLVASIVVATLLGTLISGSGLWAGITAQIVGGRASTEAGVTGGSFRIASMRLSGTVIGAMWAYFVLSVATRDAPFGASLPLLAAWAGLMAVVKTNPRTFYLGLVASFNPYVITLDAPHGAARAFAFTRVEQNLVGILSFCAFELLVLPRSATGLLRTALADAFVAGADCIRVAWEPFLLGDRCSACAAADAALDAAARSSLTKGLSRAKSLVGDVHDEPNFLRSPAAVTHLSALANTADVQLAPLLALMHAAAAAAVSAGGEALLVRIAASATGLAVGLSALFQALAEELRAGACGSASVAALVAVTDRMSAFETDYDEAVMSLRISHASGAAPMPPSALVLPLNALIFCTRELVALADTLSASMRAALRPVGEGPTCESKLLRAEELPRPHRRGSPERGICACGAPLQSCQKV